jgi:hypothetical protein
MKSTKPIRNSKKSQRAGTAPLELVLALPILLVMLSIIFAVCTGAETRMVTTTTARNAAFEKRHEPWKHNPEALELPNVERVKTILGPNPRMSASGGLVDGDASGTPKGIFGPLRFVSMDTKSRRFVLGGGWDYQELAFEKHRALTVTEKAQYFGLDASKSSAFTNLAGFGGSSSIGSSFSSVANQVTHQIANANQRSSARIAQINSQLKTLSSKLKKQQQTLDELRKNPNPDWGAIRSTRESINSTETEIRKLSTERSRLGEAKGNLGVNTSISTSDPGE